MLDAAAGVTMTDGPPSERFAADGRVALCRVRPYAVAAVLAAVGYLLVGAVASRAVGVAAASSAVAAVLTLTYVRAAGTTYAVYPDRFVVERGGPLGGRRAVAWADVAFATRRQSGRAARFGVASFELVRAGGPDVHARYVTDPARFADVLAERVPPPSAWLADRSQDRLALYVTVEALADRADRTATANRTETPNRDGAPGDAHAGGGLVVTETELAEVLGVDRGDLVADELGHITGVGSVDDVDGDRFSAAHERLVADSLGLRGSGMDADRTGSFDGVDGPTLEGSGRDGTGNRSGGHHGDAGGGAEGGGE